MKLISIIIYSVFIFTSCKNQKQKTQEVQPVKVDVPEKPQFDDTDSIKTDSTYIDTSTVQIPNTQTLLRLEGINSTLGDNIDDISNEYELCMTKAVNGVNEADNKVAKMEKVSKDIEKKYQELLELKKQSASIVKAEKDKYEKQIYSYYKKQ